MAIFDEKFGIAFYIGFGYTGDRRFFDRRRFL